MGDILADIARLTAAHEKLERIAKGKREALTKDEAQLLVDDMRQQSERYSRLCDDTAGFMED